MICPPFPAAGEIIVVSQEGKGSIFRAILPAEGVSMNEKLKILVVDDEDMMRTTMPAILADI